MPAWCTLRPDIDAGKEEQPHHVNKVPVPGSRLKAEMLLRCKVTGKRPEQHHSQRDCTHNHMETVKASRHKEGRAIDIAAARFA